MEFQATHWVRDSNTSAALASDEWCGEDSIRFLAGQEPATVHKIFHQYQAMPSTSKIHPVARTGVDPVTSRFSAARSAN